MRYSPEDVLTWGVGFTIATGELYCSFRELHVASEFLLGRPVLTHEFGIEEFWNTLRTAFRRCATVAYEKVVA